MSAHSRSSVDWHHLDLIGSHDLGDKCGLVNDVPSSELLDALAAGFESLLQGHILSVVLVEDGVDEVAGVAMGALGHLLESAQVVHPVELGGLLDLVVSAHKDVDLEGLLRSQGAGHLSAEVVGSGLDRGLKAGPNLLELQVSHHEVGEPVAVSLLTSRCQHLELVQLHDLVVIMLECEDRAIDSGVSADDHPVFSADSKYRVHYR